MYAVGILASEEGAPEGIRLFLPPLNEIFWSAVMYAAVLALFWKYVLPSLRTALAARTEGIEDKLAKAETDRAEAAALLEQYRQQLAEARSEAARIRAEAQSDRQAIVAEARTEAEQAAAAVTERAQAQLAGEVATVRAALSRDVGRLASDLAERIVGEALDPTRTSATVDRFIAGLESATATAGGDRQGRR